MPSLAEFQRAMVAEILHDQPRGAVAVHQNTVLGALVHALRLTFPTVAALSANFDQHATRYAREHPPRSPVLYQYGSSFPEYLHSPVLRDMARFDLALDRTAHQDASAQTAPIEIDASLSIRLPRSLIHLQVDYPVDLIRDAPEAPRDLTPQIRHFAIWRAPGSNGSTVRRLTPAAGAFLAALLNSDGQAEHAMQSAIEHAPPEQVIAAIQTEILHASFTTLLWQ
jgi:hypothetical protein